MIDFGFGGLVKDFEDRFGRVFTTVLVGLIGLAVATLCVNILVINLLKPLWDQARPILQSPGFNWADAFRAAWAGFQFIVVVAGAYLIGRMLRDRSKRKTIDSKWSAIVIDMEAQTEAHNDAVKHLKEAMRQDDESRELLNAEREKFAAQNEEMGKVLDRLKAIAEDSDRGNRSLPRPEA